MRTRQRPAAAVLLALLATSLASHGQQPAPTRGLIVGGPVFVPAAVSPSSSTTSVTVGATVAGPGERPPALLLEEVSAVGQPLRVVVELRDDGEGGDGIARDGRYSGSVPLGSPTESERFFRIRAPRGDSIVTPAAIFAVTTLPIGFPAGDETMSVPTPDGSERALTNQVSFVTAPDVTPRRVAEVVAQIGAEIGATVEIVGYMAALNGYLVRFDGEPTYAAIVRVAAALARRPEIVRATPTYVASPAASQWWLDKSGVTKLRTSTPNPPMGAPPPVHGSPTMAVAIIEAGVSVGISCAGGLAGRCVTNPLMGDCANAVVNSTHGTKVATLIAGDPTMPFDAVEGGLADQTKLLPLRGSLSTGIAAALDCVRSYNADLTTTPKAQVVNMSFKVGDDSVLRAAVCNAACDNLLMVAAAGNNACTTATMPFPGAYGTALDGCSCGATMGDYVLSVGGTTDTNVLGDSCSAAPPNDIKSHAGEINAPGWEIPGSDDLVEAAPDDSGTSWAAPIVAGCAAVRGAVEIWNGTQWNARDVAARLLATAPVVGPIKVLDCHAAVQDSYDVVFVLDFSGSMGAPATSGGTTTRWNVLRESVNGFAQLLAVTAPPGSRLGVKRFSTSLPANVDDPLGGIQALDAGVVSMLATNAALAMPPTGGTPMGPGLQAGVMSLGVSDRPRTVVLFTDGEQNVPRYVHEDGCNFSDTAPAQPATMPSLIDGPCPGGIGSVKIVPVGIGSPSGVYYTTLENLAASHRGTMLISSDATNFGTCAASIDAAFECAIAPAVYGTSLQMLETRLTPFVTGQDLISFDVNRGVTNLVVKLGAESSRLELGRFLDRLQIMRNGVDVTSYFKQSLGTPPSTALLYTDFLAPEGASLADLASDGSYVVRLLPSPGGAAPSGETVRVLAFADEHRLDMRWELGSDARVGEPFRPRVTLRWAGAPLTDADVVARIYRPGDDLGDALARNPTSVDPAAGPDAASPGWQKFDHLWQTNAAFRAQLAPNENVLPLLHQGDGVYTASFDPGDVSGVYQIAYEVRAASTDLGVLQREAAQSSYVRFGTIDMGKSIVSRAVRGNDITLTFKPVASNGRLVGPGQASAFGISGGSARLSSVVDHQDGTYTVVLSADPAANIEFSALGETVYTGRADFERDRRPWWIVLLLVIVAALV